MIRRFKVVLVAVVLILTGCAGKGVIPARKMSKILHDMYVLDAQISQVREYRPMADTTSVYGALLAEYGYTQEDFSKSLDYYLNNPVKFKEVFAAVHKRFEAEVGSFELNPAGALFEEEDDAVQKAGRIRSRRSRRNAQPESGQELE